MEGNRETMRVVAKCNLTAKQRKQKQSHATKWSSLFVIINMMMIIIIIIMIVMKLKISFGLLMWTRPRRWSTLMVTICPTPIEAKPKTNSNQNRKKSGQNTLRTQSLASEAQKTPSKITNNIFVSVVRANEHKQSPFKVLKTKTKWNKTRKQNSKTKLVTF